MTRLYLLLTALISFLSVQAQDTSFYDRWKQIDQLIRLEGRNQTAVAEVERLYELAKQKQQSDQMIRALAYVSGLNRDLQEDSELLNIERLRKEIQTAQAPVKQLLYSLLAKQYVDYLNQNRWRLYNRTKTTVEKSDKVDTWSMATLHQQIQQAYLQSLEPASTLQKIRIDSWSQILSKGNSTNRRPTLYDVLAFEALDYFQQGESDLPKASYAFEIYDPLVFAPAATFATTRFETRDTSSLLYRSLRIYQLLLAFHLNDAKPEALLDADLSRLHFFHQHSVSPDKDQQYQQALSQLHQSFPKHELGALAALRRLEERYRLAGTFVSGISDAKERMAIAGIRQELIPFLKKFKKSEAQVRAKNLLQQIDQPLISVTTELVQIPGKSFLALATFKNTPQFSYRIIPLKEAWIERSMDTDSMWIDVLAQRPIREVRQSLPLAGDLREHTTEIGIDGLPAGAYALVSSVKQDFSTTQNDLSLQFFHVSRISYINKGDQYVVVDRHTGAPLANAELEMIEEDYSYSTEQTEYHVVAHDITNQNGYARLPASRSRRPVGVRIRWQNDTLFTRKTGRYSFNFGHGHMPNHLVTFLFTDRAIYRPGQTLYVKGIMVNRDGEGVNHHVIPGRPTRLGLYDANGDLKDEQQVFTNAYGSYSLRFTLPEGGLTGTWYLRDDEHNAYKSFNVEEYKRPGFEVSWIPGKELYKLDDTVSITGTVKAYAGNLLNNSLVKYRVVRKPILPWYWRWYFPEEEGRQQEIAHGEVRSDAQGQFQIRFKALADKSASATSDPRYTFEITADATDASGETRSGSKEIRLSYQSLHLQLALDEEAYSASALEKIAVKATNFDGQPQELPVTLSLQRLKGPDRLLRERYWKAPDTTAIDRESFIKSFPNDPYGREDIPSEWPVEKEWARVSGKPGILTVPTTLPSGYYMAEVMATTAEGPVIRDKRLIRVNGRVDAQASPRYLQAGEGSFASAPGKTVTVPLGSAASDVFLLRFPEQKSSPEWLFSPARIINGSFTDTLKTQEEDRGGYGVLYAFVKDNRLFTHTIQVDVPWDNKELNIEVESYRDKLLPGSAESWSVKVSGSKGEKVAAELLTSMYDASLDQYRYHEWRFPDMFRRYFPGSLSGESNFTTTEEERNTRFLPLATIPERIYDALIWNRLPDRLVPEQVFSRNKMLRKSGRVMAMAAAPASALNEMVVADSTSIRIRGNSSLEEEKEPAPAEIPLRKNFKETAFFFPQLLADSSGTYRFQFTLPESLTRWKWQLLAHTEDLATGTAIKEIVSQKPLMIAGQMPRFLREGDRIRLSARVSNLTEKEITGMALLQLIDPQNGQPVDGWFQNIFPSQYFTVEAGQSGVVHFEIQVPYNVNRPVTYRLSAKAGLFTDGEENILPVLSNRGLVTESVPLLVKGNTTQRFELPGLLRSTGSSTLSHHSVTVEYATNPAWYAVLSLPYLMEYPYECAEQSFNRYYANAVASKIANSSPVIKQLFEEWKKGDSSVFMSNLMKNAELKTVLLEQTPWVFEAKSETEQRKNIARLFDQLRLAEEGQRALYRVRQLQQVSGGFSWFPGGPEDRYMTQYILTGVARLKTLQAATEGTQSQLDAIAEAGLRYVDEQIRKDYAALLEDSADLKKNHLGPLQLQYLYLRSQLVQPVSEEAKEAHTFYLQQARQFWQGRSGMENAMLAVALFRNGDKPAAERIVRSLAENAITSETLGMYWKGNTIGYYWYHLPVETQSMLIEAFHTVGGWQKEVENMKLWLLNQKRVQRWASTKSTADAVYALLITGGNTLTVKPKATIRLGELTLSSTMQKSEAGTGYFKERIAGDRVKAEMGNITVSIKDAAPGMASWGAVHWQYMEEYDKIQSAETTVKLKRAFFIQRMGDQGPVLEALEEGKAMHVGDKLVVRVVLSADRDMEYMHLRDMRPSGTEPVNVLSRYQYRDGLGYYESTRDASTDFFFSWVPKGTWVFEYPLFVTHAGRFSAGISTIQSMYAPEFNAHSEGLKVDVTGN